MAKHCGPRCGHVHFSNLKLMGRSPAHYRQAYEFGTDETAAMQLGTAIHLAVLEDSAGLVKFEGARRAGKDWEAFKAAAPASATILLADDFDRVQAIAAAVRVHPRAAELLEGAREQTFDFEVDGIPCRSTTDVVKNHGTNRIVDLKSTTDASPGAFQRTADRLGYFAQLPFYQNGAQLAGLGTFDDAFIVAVETSAPYVVQTFRLTPFALDTGMRTWRTWFERFKVCRESNDWPGYQQTDAALEPTLTFGDEGLVAG
jgi:hypothetical protein